MSKAPLCKGSLPIEMGTRLRSRQRGRRVRVSAKLTEGLFCVDYRFLQSLRHGKPCHLPLHKGGLVLVPLERDYGWQFNTRRTCAQPVLLGLCPKLKYPPLYGGIFIYFNFQIANGIANGRSPCFP